MLRPYSAEEITAIQQRTIVVRDLFSIIVRNRDTNALVEYNFSTMARNLSISLVDGKTGSTTSKTFTGLGKALTVGQLSLTVDLTIRTCDVNLPSGHATVEEVIREFDPRNAPCQVHRAFLDPATRAQVAAAKPRFVGYVDLVTTTTPKFKESGGHLLRLASITRELVRSSVDVRSHESQLLRNATDKFYQFTAAVQDWEIFWGRATGPLTTTSGKTSPPGQGMK